MGDPTAFVETAAVTPRELEVPGAEFTNGMNVGGSCACGIGINMLEGAVVGTPEQFTLLDQHGNARVAQISENIGGFAYVDRSTVPWPGSGGLPFTGNDAVIRYGTNPTNAAKEAADPSIDGSLIPVGNAALESLAAGWTDVTP